MQGVGWRSVFVINVPIVAGAFAMTTRVVPESTEREDRRLNLAGVLLAAALLGAITFALIEAGHAGVGAPVVGAALLATGLLAVFVRVERRAEDPMLPLALRAAPTSRPPTPSPGR